MVTQSSFRPLTAYEQTHLARFGSGSMQLAANDQRPVEYITGKVEFYNRVFSVTPDVLIPRVETEELVHLALTSIQSNTNQEPVIADIGTGSGAIGITLYLELLQLNYNPTLFLSDISENALKIAQSNKEHLIDQSKEDNTTTLTLLKSDVFKNYPENILFDLIVANLPYIPSARIHTLDSSVKDFEPHLALDGGHQGVKYISSLIDQAQSRLKPGGTLLLEVDDTHTKDFLVENIPLLAQHIFSLETKQDSFKRTRFAVIRFL